MPVSLAWSAWLATASADEHARVVVLGWPRTEADATSDKVQKAVAEKLALAGEAAPPLFVADWETVDERPADSPDAAAIEAALGALRVANATPAAWGHARDQLRALADRVFVDTPEERIAMFRLHAVIGTAVERSGVKGAPWYVPVDGAPVNVHWLVAAWWSNEDPSLLTVLGAEAARPITELGVAVRGAARQPVWLSIDGRFDAAAFLKDHTLRLDGRPVVPNGTNDALLRAPIGSDLLVESPGRDTVALRLAWPDGQPQFPLERARLIAQQTLSDALVAHPDDARPTLPPSTLARLRAYAARHPEDHLFVAVPLDGNPKRTRLWALDEYGLLLAAE